MNLLRKRPSSNWTETKMATLSSPSTSILPSFSSPPVKSTSIPTTTQSTTSSQSATSPFVLMPPCLLVEFVQGTPVRSWREMESPSTKWHQKRIQLTQSSRTQVQAVGCIYAIAWTSYRRWRRRRWLSAELSVSVFWSTTLSDCLKTSLMPRNAPSTSSRRTCPRRLSDLRDTTNYAILIISA